MLASWAKATRIQYEGAAKRWLAYCETNAIQAISPTVNQVIEFLQGFLTSGKSAGTLNTHKSMLSSFVILDNLPAGEHPMIKRLNKGAGKSKPKLPKYVDTWDPTPVIAYMSQWGPTETLQWDKLVKRTMVLFLFATGQRLQALHCLLKADITWMDSRCRIVYSTPMKTNHPATNPLVLRFCEHLEDPLSCVFSHLKRCVTHPNAELTKLAVFGTTNKNVKPASSDTLSKYVRDTLIEGGIPERFTAYSSRHASTSGAKRKNIPLPDIMASAGWLQATTFTRFYDRPLTEEQRETNFIPALIQGGPRD